MDSIYEERLNKTQERKEKLMKYFKEQFEPMDNHFTYDLVENIIDHGIIHNNVSKHQLAYFLSDLIPEVEFEELDLIIGY